MVIRSGDTAYEQKKTTIGWDNIQKPTQHQDWVEELVEKTFCNK